MCGIIVYSKRKFNKTDPLLLKKMYSVSKRRGSQSCGLSVWDFNRKNIDVHKFIGNPNKLFSDKNVIESLNSKTLIGNPTVLIGHTRMQTDGDYNNHLNNQPVLSEKSLLIHNGIVCNFNEIKKEKGFITKSDLDSEIISIFFDNYFENYKIENIFQQLENSVVGTLNIVYKNLKDNNLYLYTNNGSLYYYFDSTNETFICLSELSFYKKLSSKKIDINKVVKLNPREVLIYSITSNKINKFSIDNQNFDTFNYDFCPPNKLTYFNNSEIKTIEIKSNKYHIFKNIHDKVAIIKRCSRCILPETFPFIQFDDLGICNYCHSYKKNKFLGEEQLIKDLKNSRKSPNLLVTLSGGRDSCYGLHYITKNLGFKATAYSYDWGLVTDLARRNQARMCQKLGIEHILVSADINQKRNNVKKNLTAWLKSPNIGLIPLLIAGDKQYFEYANLISQEISASSVILCENMLETTHFKTGYLGIKPNFNSNHTFSLSLFKKFQLLNFYISEFAKNPSYLNSSLIDSARAFIVYYFSPKNYINLFNYIPWEENEIQDTLINDYDWELSPDTKTTWRIGDGTAAFYNYIYFIYGGFTEFDTFRSNQIREGQINRNTALELVKIENQTREDSFVWYCNTIGLDVDFVLKNLQRLKSHPILE